MNDDIFIIGFIVWFIILSFCIGILMLDLTERKNQPTDLTTTLDMMVGMYGEPKWEGECIKWYNVTELDGVKVIINPETGEEEKCWRYVQTPICARWLETATLTREIGG